MITETLQNLLPYMVYIILAILIFAIIIGIGIVIITTLAIKRASRKRAVAPPVPGQTEEKGEKPPLWQRIKASIRATLEKWGCLPADEVAHSFVDTLDILKRYIGGHDYRYKIPWYLMLGAEGAGKTEILKNLDLELPIGKPDFKYTGDRPRCGWWFFNRGIVLDLRGDYVLAKDETRSDETGWKYFLSLISRHRPKRPLDGIVLTIPCDELIGAKALTHDEIVERANYLHRKLWQIQSTLGMKVPVYVIVTKCDSIEGFQNFVKELPNQSLKEIFGWSVPYSIDTAYSASWVDNIFGYFRSTLIKIRAQVFTETKERKGRDKTFLFNIKFSEIKKSLGLYLNNTFRDSSYHESFFLRGVYFSGDNSNLSLEELAVKETSSDKAEGQEKEKSGYCPVFLQGLFKEKIFRESALAQPIMRLFVSANKALNFAKAAVIIVSIVWVLGLLSNYNRLSRVRTYVLPVIEQIDRAMSGVNELSVSNALENRLDAFINQQSDILIRLMTEIKEVDTFALFIPASWVSHLDENIRKTITIAYDKIILKSLFSELHKKAKKNITLEKIELKETDNKVGFANPLKMNSFKTMQTYVTDIENLIYFTDKFNALESTQSVPDLGKVIKYIFDRDLPSQFYNDTDYYERALSKTLDKNVVLDQYKEAARSKLRDLFRRFVDNAFDINQNMTIVANFVEYMEELTRPGKSVDDDRLRFLLTKADEVKDFIESSELKWIQKTIFEPGDDYVTLINTIARSPLFGVEIAEELSHLINARFKDYQRSIKQVSSTITKTLFTVKEGRVYANVSKSFKDLIEQLKLFIEKPFMTKTESYKTAVLVPPGKMLFWDEITLQRAVQHIDDFNKFILGELAELSPELRGVFLVVGRNAVRKKVQYLISKAQVYHDEPSAYTGFGFREMLKSQVENVKTATPLFTKLLGTFEGGGYVVRTSGVRSLLITETYKILKKIDSLLERDNLYNIKESSFNWWDGTGKIGFKAFGVNDEEGMGFYLAAQRERIIALAREMAEPLLSFLSLGYLEKSPSNLPLVLKWHRIITQLQAYEAKEPNNSLGVLESFLLNEIKDISYETCISGEILKRGDYFLDRCYKIQETLFKRCLTLAATRIKERYNKIATYFNIYLAGRFPFTEPNNPRGVGEANLEHVNTFLQLFDLLKPADFAALEKDSTISVSKSQVLRFLNKIDSLKHVLRASLNQEMEQSVPKVDFLVEFRTERGKETGGNQIIDWKLFSGDKIITQRDEEKKGEWAADRAIGVILRWASNGARMPIPDFAQKNLEIREGAAVFKYSGQWALLQMLKNHSVPTDNLDTQTLKFVIPTTSLTSLTGRSKLEEEIVGVGKKTVVFVDLKLVAQSDKFGPDGNPVEEPIMEIRDFPSIAPILSKVNLG